MSKGGRFRLASYSSMIIAKSSYNDRDEHFTFAQGVRKPKVPYNRAKKCNLPFYTKEFFPLPQGKVETVHAFMEIFHENSSILCELFSTTT